MADPNTPSDTAESSGGWWGSWINSAKNKSAEVYSLVKKDLDEIGNAVKNEASHVYTATSSAIEKTFKFDEEDSTANTVKKSLSTFLGQVNTVLNPEPDDEDTEVILSTGDTTVLSTYKKEIEALQRLDATFLVPTETPEFEAWRSSLETGADAVISPGAAARRLRNETLLAAQYDRLVPNAVSEQLFWERYLFRTALLQDRIAACVRRAKGSNVELPVSADPVLAHLPLQPELHVESQPPRVETPSAASTRSPSPVSKSPSHSIAQSGHSVSQSGNSISRSGNSISRSGNSISRSANSVSQSGSPSVDTSLNEDVDEGVAWEDEDFASDVELTEEQQTLLLQEYEREITTKKHSKSKDRSSKTKKQDKQNKSHTSNKSLDSKQSSKDTTKIENDVKSKSTNEIDLKLNEESVEPEKFESKPTKSNSTSSKIDVKSSNVNSKSSKVDIKTSTHTAKPSGEQAEIKKSVIIKTSGLEPVKSKTDACGKNLVEDHFKIDEQKVKDDASSNSDESWEKEFEIDEPAA